MAYNFKEHAAWQPLIDEGLALTNVAAVAAKRAGDTLTEAQYHQRRALQVSSIAAILQNVPEGSATAAEFRDTLLDTDTFGSQARIEGMFTMGRRMLDDAPANDAYERTADDFQQFQIAENLLSWGALKKRYLPAGCPISAASKTIGRGTLALSKVAAIREGGEDAIREAAYAAVEVAIAGLDLSDE